MTLYPEPVHIITNTGSLNRITHLRDIRVNAGAVGSGVSVNATTILRSAGIWNSELIENFSKSEVPGKLKESLLIEALRYESFEMPPKKKLPDSVIADFRMF